MKDCIECGKEFDNRIYHGRRKFCSKKCSLDNWYKNNREWIREYVRLNANKKNEARRKKYANDEKYREKAIGKVREYTKKYPDRQKYQRLFHNYGISKEQYLGILEKQNNKCAICKCSFIDKNDIHFDHNHNTGGNRGILCGSCNLAIGKFKDSQELLKNAIAYLERYDNG